MQSGASGSLAKKTRSRQHESGNWSITGATRGSEQQSSPLIESCPHWQGTRAAWDRVASLASAERSAVDRCEQHPRALAATRSFDGTFAQHVRTGAEQQPLAAARREAQQQLSPHWHAEERPTPNDGIGSPTCPATQKISISSFTWRITPFRLRERPDRLQPSTGTAAGMLARSCLDL